MTHTIETTRVSERYYLGAGWEVRRGGCTLLFPDRGGVYVGSREGAERQIDGFRDFKAGPGRNGSARARRYAARFCDE